MTGLPDLPELATENQFTISSLLEETLSHPRSPDDVTHIEPILSLQRSPADITPRADVTPPSRTQWVQTDDPAKDSQCVQTEMELRQRDTEFLKMMQKRCIDPKFECKPTVVVLTPEQRKAHRLSAEELGKFESFEDRARLRTVMRKVGSFFLRDYFFRLLISIESCF